MVEVLYRGKRVASHARSGEQRGSTTETGHQPKSHQRYREWTPTRLLEWAEAIGPFTRRLVEAMLIDKPHPEAGYRAAMGLRPLASQYGDPRLEAAATRRCASSFTGWKTSGRFCRPDSINNPCRCWWGQQPSRSPMTTFAARLTMAQRWKRATTPWRWPDDGATNH